VEKYRNELIKRIADCHTVIDGISNNSAWKVVVRDLTKNKELIDNNWHLVNDEKKLTEFRVTKFAVVQLLNTIENYKNDLKAAEVELRKLDNPDKEIVKDYDGEGNYEKK